MYIQFGVGQALANPVAGNLATVHNPVQFATLQDIDVSIDQTLKELKGQYQFPDDVAPADRKGSGKIGTGRINVDSFNQLFFADSIATGIKILSAREQHTIPADTAYTATVTHTTGWVDLGVVYAATGIPFKAVTTPSGAGEYSAATGIYTFNIADASAVIQISYTYTAATGKTLTVNQQLMGYGPVFELWLADPYQGNNGLHLFACRAGNLKMPRKRDDYLITEMDFQFFPNSIGQVMEFFAA